MDLIDWDQEFFIYLNNLGTTSWDSFWLTITNKETWIPLYLIFIFFIFKTFKGKKVWVIILCAGFMILCTDQISHLYKDTLVQRLRPCKDPNISIYVRLVKEYCGGKYGFFSGHATNHMAVAVYVGLIFKSKKWILPALILWALSIAYSRIYIGVHYPLDVLSGILMGSLFAYFFYQVQDSISNKLS